ncbi:hypothetical protein EXT51_00395 [Pectobacterium carotovorum subsp. carotovorum]|uniref:hypothetical protein n=1 Tax=Pectobacterium carotovorum TaxID=554 RepID=UPI00202D568D|nr:hypothetical protein [Pectobacterium carotovorum]MCL6327979.1 hypothetical protein [Pectobacterium carotovorum subsp. carotovorum]
MTNSPSFGTFLLATLFCRLLCQSAHGGATRYSSLNVNGDNVLIDRHKKLSGEVFNVASATVRKGGSKGWQAIKKRRERFSTSLAAARKVAARDGRHKKRQHSGWRLGSVPTVMSEKMPNYA